ncbi:Uncharacterised protein [Suttonella indologenes]|uniref:Uncharacterized protein n=1 Tax=Suttonella indologenes TaxID=13276 RepID=A0A380N009_9GAMM|nr:Uncharacterised protein [Suttonella indologenes]
MGRARLGNTEYSFNLLIIENKKGIAYDTFFIFDKAEIDSPIMTANLLRSFKTEFL